MITNNKNNMKVHKTTVSVNFCIIMQERKHEILSKKIIALMQVD